jgi:hypothetical protein
MEQVSDETNISKRFLQGIETDNFEDFPGEVYIFGFLRNYAEFLGLDAAKIVEIYRQSDGELEQVTEPPPPTSTAPSTKGETPGEALAQPPLSTPAAETKERKRDEVTSAQSQIQAPFRFSEKEERESPSPSSSSKKKKTTANRKSREKAIPNRDEERGEPPSVSAQRGLAREPKLSSSSRRVALVQAGRVLPFILLGLVLLVAAISIIPTLKISSATSRTPSEYRAEGLPFEQRLYPQDKVYLPLGDDFISITLKAIKDKVVFDTPYGTLTTGMNEDAVMNPSADQERLVATVLDYSPNEPKNGALVRFDVKEALSQSGSSGDITVSEGANKAPTPQAAQGQDLSVVLFKSPGGPHPFYVSVSFMSPVLFRYEADRKEWVEKYYRKGESITINASNSITFWTANAQAVKVNVFQAAGKSTELVMGGPGEIAVRRLSWSNAQGGWAMVAAPLD